jgi:hypothetical protein
MAEAEVVVAGATRAAAEVVVAATTMAVAGAEVVAASRDREAATTAASAGLAVCNLHVLICAKPVRHWRIATRPTQPH